MIRPSLPGARGGIGYRPDLDGLRAIAVGLVMLMHAQWPWENSGADAGVTAFFVLSGFLITSILLRERDRDGRIDIVRFYRRRVVRLAPALLGLLAFTLILGVLADPPTNWRLGIVSCLAYLSNWVQVAGISINPLGHTWSLAIEEQFYLVWPLILIVARGRVLRLAVAAILVASAVRLVTSGTFEYFSTITRADAILLGCVVAIVQPRWPAWVGAAGVAALVGAALALPPSSHDIAIPLAMAATVAVIGGALEPLGRLAPIGLRAYSLYLWNWPMTILFGPMGLAAPAATVIAGEISFRLLEVPVLRRGPARRATPAPPPVAVRASVTVDTESGR